MLFISPQKLFLFSKYLGFYLDFFIMYQKRLIKKVKLKFHEVTTWLTNNYNIHIAQYLEK